MRAIVQQKKVEHNFISEISLEDLVEKARSYGHIDIFECNDDRTFSAQITFHTKNHIELKAKSGWRHATVASALISAIDNAQEIKEQFKDEK